MIKNRNLKLIYNVAGFAVIVFLAIREMCGAVIARLPLDAESPLLYIIGIAVFFAACLVPVVLMENTLGMHPRLFRRTDGKTAAAAVAYGYLLIIGASFVNSVALMVLWLWKRL